MRANLSSGAPAAIPFYRRAIEIDPQFAMAYASLGLAYSSVGESVLSAESTTKAWQLRDRVSDREKFLIDFIYEREVTGNLEKAYQTLETWYQTYPRGEQPSPHDLLGGLSTHGTGRFERAIEVSREQLRPILTVVFGTTIWHRVCFSSTASPKPRRLLSKRPNARWKNLIFSCFDTPSLP